MGRGDRAQVSTDGGDDGLREHVCGVYASVEPAGVRGRGHPPDEEGEGPLKLTTGGNGGVLEVYHQRRRRSRNAFLDWGEFGSR